MSNLDKPKPDLPPPRRTQTAKHPVTKDSLYPSSSPKDVKISTNHEQVSPKTTRAEPNSSFISPPRMLAGNINPFATPTPTDLSFRNESYFNPEDTLQETSSTVPISTVVETGFTFLSDASPPSTTAQPLTPNKKLSFDPRPPHFLPHPTSAPASQPTFSNTKFSSSTSNLTSVYDDIPLASPPLITTTSLPPPARALASSAPASQTTFHLPFSNKAPPLAKEEAGQERIPPSATKYTFLDDCDPVSPRTEKIQQHVAHLGLNNGSSSIFQKAARPTSIPIAGHLFDPNLLPSHAAETQAVIEDALPETGIGIQSTSGNATPTQSSLHPNVTSPILPHPAVFGEIDAEGNSEERSPDCDMRPRQRPNLSRGELFSSLGAGSQDCSIKAMREERFPTANADLNSSTEVTVTISTTAQGTSISIRIPGRDEITVPKDGSSGAMSRI